MERYDCLDWIHWVNERTESQYPIYLAGVSMGASTVLMAAGLELPENVKGVVADCGFTSAYYEMFLLELTTGMRRGEIIGLKWRDLNIQTGELSISRQVVKTGKSIEITAPKTKFSIRTILLPPDMIEILAETALNIYSHITDTMQQQAAVRIDREIGGTNAQMPEPILPEENTAEQLNDEPKPMFEPYKGKIRKSGTGCVYQINDSLWEGSFYPRMPDGKRKKFNIYAKTREACEKKLVAFIEEKKAEIKAEKEKLKQGSA